MNDPTAGLARAAVDSEGPSTPLPSAAPFAVHAVRDAAAMTASTPPAPVLAHVADPSSCPPGSQPGVLVAEAAAVASVGAALPHAGSGASGWSVAGIEAAARTPDPSPPSGAPASMGLAGTIAVPLPKICPSCHLRYPADFRVCPRDASPLEDGPGQVDDPLIGHTLGEAYRIVRVIGEGGMGRVYEARHTRLSNKRFAVKMLHAEYARQPEVVARFQREAEAASGISHPNVIGVYDVHRTEDGRPYLVSEYLEGEELGDYLHRKKTIPASLAVRIVRQVCRALGAAHGRGVVHRDMKPENVFLVGSPENPTVKVIDFGISKVGDAGGTTLTRTGMIMGTPSYMAPEQARGEKVDHRADIYAVGGIMYRALTGRKPFDSDDPSTTLTQVLTDDPMRPRSIDATIPEALELVIQRAMAKDPRERHQSMAELDADLAAIEPGQVHDSGAPATGDDAPTDVGALTVLATATRQDDSQAQVLMATHAVKRARPTIVLLTFVGYVWLLIGLVDAMAGTVRLARGPGDGVSRTEAVLISLACALATVTPLGLWIRHLARVWGNSMRSVLLAQRMRRILTVSLATAAAGGLLLRVFEVLVHNTPSAIAWAAWSPVLFLASTGAAALAYLALARRGQR